MPKCSSVGQNLYAVYNRTFGAFPAIITMNTPCIFMWFQPALYMLHSQLAARARRSVHEAWQDARLLELKPQKHEGTHTLTPFAQQRCSARHHCTAISHTHTFTHTSRCIVDSKSKKSAQPVCSATYCHRSHTHTHTHIQAHHACK